jgi:hypothetical protein
MHREEFKEIDTVEYFLVYSELIHAARHRGSVTYQELAHVVGLPLSGNQMGLQIGNLLGAVSFNEVENGRPMLSAIGVTVKGNVGAGFFNLARQLGLLDSDHPADEDAFLQEQVHQIYRIWQQQFPKQ